MNAVSALILGAAIIIGSFLIGGRYDSHFRQGGILMADRLTGTVRICTGDGCRVLE